VRESGWLIHSLSRESISAAAHFHALFMGTFVVQIRPTGLESAEFAAPQPAWQMWR
jgi:hypothetical protein